MKTTFECERRAVRQLAAAIFVTICLGTSSSRGQATEDSPINPGSTQNTGLFVPAPEGYLWKTFYVDEQPKPRLTGITVDAAGNVYGVKGCAIVRIAPGGKMTIIAGTVEVAGNVDGAGSAAQFNAPHSLALDGGGNLYVSDQKNHTIRKIAATGAVTTLAGCAGLKGSADGIGADARFYHPGGIGLDGLGNLFVGDVCNRSIRRVTPAGIVSTLAGRNVPGQARLNNSDTAVGAVEAFAVDGGGDIFYFRRMSHAIRKVTPDGTITTVGGVDEQTTEAVDGPRDIARFLKPKGLAIDLQGNIYVTDLSTIRKMSPDGTVSTIGGKPGTPGLENATNSVTRFNGPLGVAISSTGVVYVSCSDGIVQGTPVE